MLIDYSRRVFGPQIDTFHVHRLLLHTQHVLVCHRKAETARNRPPINIGKVKWRERINKRAARDKVARARKGERWSTRESRTPPPPSPSAFLLRQWLTFPACLPIIFYTTYSTFSSSPEWYVRSCVKTYRRVNCHGKLAGNIGCSRAEKLSLTLTL